MERSARPRSGFGLCRRFSAFRGHAWTFPPGRSYPGSSFREEIVGLPSATHALSRWNALFAVLWWTYTFHHASSSPRPCRYPPGVGLLQPRTDFHTCDRVTSWSCVFAINCARSNAAADLRGSWRSCHTDTDRMVARGNQFPREKFKRSMDTACVSTWWKSLPRHLAMKWLIGDGLLGKLSWFFQ